MPQSVVKAQSSLRITPGEIKMSSTAMMSPVKSSGKIVYVHYVYNFS